MNDGSIVVREQSISPGDFPDLKKMQELLASQDFSKFNPMKVKLIEMVDGMLASDIGRLMRQIPVEEEVRNDKQMVKGGAFMNDESPFGFGRGEGVDAGFDEPQWIVYKEKYKYDEMFDKLNPVDGKLSGAVAKSHMIKSKLPNSTLSRIWKLSDVDKDGMLDSEEFALANYLINLKLDGHEIPPELPAHLIPPSKKGFYSAEDS
ncbi:unnamed protein product [Soboliphyme baturini]|uniref:EH domain-containing protein n=1 Tax=Soboliphyme baturini TaxID=241478 RepID=A0A183J970_9BILA|nr:unnamed protein product [Soboliphyme baturini]